MGRSTTRSRPEDEPPPDRSRARGRTRRRRDRALRAPTARTVARPRPRRRGVPTRARRRPDPAARRRPPGRTAADRATPTPTRRRQLAVVALGAVDRARADRGRVHRQQPRGQQLVEGRPHVLAVRRTPVDDGNVKSIEFNKSTGAISGTFATPVDGKTEFSSSGPKDDLPDTMLANAQQEGRRPQVRRRRQQHPRRHPAVGAAARADHRLLRVDEPARAGADGRGHEHRHAAGPRSTTPRSRRRRSTTSPATAR